MHANRNLGKVKKKIYIIHEYGAKRHFVAIDHRLRSEGYHVTYTDLNFTKRFIKAILKMSVKDLISISYDLWNLALYLFSNDRAIIALAPLNLWAAVFIFSKNRHIYFTSWIDWRRGMYPHVSSSMIFEVIWKTYINQIYAACVTEKSAHRLRIMGAKSLSVGHAVEIIDLKGNVKMPKSVAFVGRIEKEKGILDLIEIINSTLGADFIFHVMGDGSLKKLLEASCLNSKAKIIMYGHIGEKDVMRVLKNCEFLLSLSQRNPKTNWEELFGINIIQGMSAGCNVITFPAPGPSEIISDGVNGHIVEDVESALCVLSNGYDVGLAEAASEHVKYNYSYKAVADKWLRVLSNISISV